MASQNGSLSAAQLQQQHSSLEGAPDPFPSLLNGHSEPKKVKSAPPPSNGALDNSENAFPTLAPSAGASKAATNGKKAGPSPWASGGASALKKAIPTTPVYSSNFTLARVDPKDRDGKPITLGSVMKDVMAKTKTKIEASSQRTSGGTTFMIKGESERAVETAIRSITAALSPKVTLTVEAPISTIGQIIGPKGANLNRIREESGNNVKVDIPRRENVEVPKSTGEDDEEPTVTISISGPQSLAEDVRSEIQSIINSKRSKSTQRVKEVPTHILPFISSQKGEYQSEEVSVTINHKDQEIVITGDRESVAKVLETIKARIAELNETLESAELSVPKRQHRILLGAAPEIFEKTKCVVIPVAPTEPGDSVAVWGASDDISGALGVVYEKARSKYAIQVPLPSPASYSTQIRTYLARTGYLKGLHERHAGEGGVEGVYLVSEELFQKTGVAHVDFVGKEKKKVDEATKELANLIRNLEGALRDVEVDWLVHKTLIGRHGKKIKAFQEQNNVLLYFPAESSESSTVLLVHDPLNVSPTPLSSAQKQAHLDEVQKELLKLAADAADVKTVTIEVDSKWHPAVLGRNGTTLNAIIGEDKVLSVKVGQQAKVAPGASPLGKDDIIIRGPANEVDRAVKEINKIVEDAKNDEIDNGFSLEFDVPRDFVGRIVGSGGAGVNKLRDSLGVNLDFSDEQSEEKEGKKKKTGTGKAHVKITGRKENVEEAKKRILSQVEKLADETTEILKIARSLHSGLIGQGGKYVIRLEEKYSVKITFPRGESDEAGSEEQQHGRRENLKPDEVLIKGGKKGVAGAKAEILEAVEYEKESSNVVKFTVPTRAVARILGKAGASINAIKDETGAQIDIDKPTEGDLKDTNVQLKGTKKAIAAAKEAILAIANEVSDEVTETITIEHKFHRNIIGSGGQTLRDLITAAGGPVEPRLQAGLVHFPRPGEPADEVRLRGAKALVTKIKASLESLAAEHRDKVVHGVSIPAAQHRALIGRGGQHLNELQARTGVTVQFPGSRSYNSVGEPSNLAELGDVDPTDLVKVTGPSSGVAKAIKELTASATKAAAASASSEPRAARGPSATATITIPLKYHHSITQQNNLFRTLRSYNVSVEQSKVPQKSASSSRAPVANGNGARIDDEEEENGVEWHVAENYQDAEEGDSEWTLKARDEEGLEQGRKIINDALEHAKLSSHIGYLTLADRSVFPRIVGAKGANVARLRAETGADITVGRDDNLITIVGTESAIQDAKEAILKTVNTPSRDR